jgi:hypothetical protein
MSFKGTVSRDGGRDEPMEQQFRPRLMFVNPFFRLQDCDVCFFISFDRSHVATHYEACSFAFFVFVLKFLNFCVSA